MKVQIISFCLFLVLGLLHAQSYTIRLETQLGNDGPVNTKILYIDYNNQNYGQFTNGALVPITMTYVNGLANRNVLLNTIDPQEFDLLIISAENVAFGSIYSNSELSTVDTVITDFTNAGKAFLLTGFDTIEDPYDSFWIGVLGGNGAYDCYNAGNYDFDIVVTDNEPPEITCPSDVVEFSDDISGKVVFFEDPVVDDNCPTTVTLTSTASSGDFFPVGTTLVTFAAADSLFNVTCTLALTVVYIPPTDTPSQTKIFLPSHTSAEKPTNPNTPLPEVSRDQVSPSESRTGTRTGNPSISQSGTPPASQSAPAPPPSPSGTPAPSNSRTSAPSESRTPDALVIAPSTSPSKYVPSQSPSRTPDVNAIVFVQTSDSALVELIIPCLSTICSQEEAQIYLDLIAISLNIPTSDLILVNIFGDEVTFLICGSNDIADLLNDINFNTPQEFAGVFVESANFDASCNPQEYYFPEDSSIANTIAISSSFIIFISFIISLF